MPHEKCPEALGHELCQRRPVGPFCVTVCQNRATWKPQLLRRTPNGAQARGAINVSLKSKAQDGCLCCLSTLLANPWGKELSQQGILEDVNPVALLKDHLLFASSHLGLAVGQHQGRASGRSALRSRFRHPPRTSKGLGAGTDDLATIRLRFIVDLGR